MININLFLRVDGQRKGFEVRKGRSKEISRGCFRDREPVKSPKDFTLDSLVISKYTSKRSSTNIRRYRRSESKKSQLDGADNCIVPCLK